MSKKNEEERDLYAKADLMNLAEALLHPDGEKGRKIAYFISRLEDDLKAGTAQPWRKKMRRVRGAAEDAKKDRISKEHRENGKKVLKLIDDYPGEPERDDEALKKHGKGRHSHENDK